MPFTDYALRFTHNGGFVAIEALKRIFQIPALKKQKEVAPAREQKKRKPSNTIKGKPPNKEKEGSKGEVDIKI